MHPAKIPRLFRERETPPRFAQHGTFEYEYSQRWKSLDEMEKQQREQVEKNMKDAKDKLESEMEDAYHEHQANLLRQGKNSPKLPFEYESLIVCVAKTTFSAV